MAADDEEASLNKNDVADGGAFASALLGWGYITYEDGAALKENLLTASAALTEAITAGVVSTNRPKGESETVTDESFSYFSSVPLSQEMEPVTLLMAEEEYEPKENPPTPPDLWGANNAATKEKLPSSYL